jgi:hypothetical protein
LTTNAANAVEKARETPTAKIAATRNQELATFILQETKEAATIEDLIYLEMMLQKYDFLTAKTASDQKIIKNAQIPRAKTCMSENSQTDVRESL